MLKALWLILFSFFLLTGCVEKGARLQDEFRVDNNKVYRDSFSIREKTIPLPPGDWKVMASGFDAEKFFKLYLVQEHTGRLFSYIYILLDSLELNREYGYKPSTEITRKDLHHTVLNKNVDGEAKDWWLVNNLIVQFTPKDNDPVYNDVPAYIKSHNYIISNDVVAIQHHLTGAHPYKKRYLFVSYAYNPEAAGFAPGPKTEWKTSDWNAMRVNEDPRKVQFVKELIQKHTLMHEKIKAGFHAN